MDRLTDVCWGNLDPWECCGQDNYCKRGCHDEGGCTKGCIVPKLYVRLAAYEDTGLEPEEIERVLDAYGRSITLRAEVGKRLEIIRDIPTEQLIGMFSNEPFTVEEILEMDGKPVWNDTLKQWAIVDANAKRTFNVFGRWRPLSDCYYRRKPEEGTT